MEGNMLAIYARAFAEAAIKYVKENPQEAELIYRNIMREKQGIKSQFGTTIHMSHSLIKNCGYQDSPQLRTIFEIFEKTDEGKKLLDIAKRI